VTPATPIFRKFFQGSRVNRQLEQNPLPDRYPIKRLQNWCDVLRTSRGLIMALQKLIWFSWWML